MSYARGYDEARKAFEHLFDTPLPDVIQAWVAAEKHSSKQIVDASQQPAILSKL